MHLLGWCFACFACFFFPLWHPSPLISIQRRWGNIKESCGASLLSRLFCTTKTSLLGSRCSLMLSVTDVLRANSNEVSLGCVFRRQFLKVCVRANTVPTPCAGTRSWSHWLEIGRVAVVCWVWPALIFTRLLIKVLKGAVQKYQLHNLQKW